MFLLVAIWSLYSVVWNWSELGLRRVRRALGRWVFDEGAWLDNCDQWGFHLPCVEGCSSRGLCDVYLRLTGSQLWSSILFACGCEVNLKQMFLWQVCCVGVCERMREVTNNTSSWGIVCLVAFGSPYQQ